MVTSVNRGGTTQRFYEAYCNEIPWLFTPGLNRDWNTGWMITSHISTFDARVCEINLNGLLRVKSTRCGIYTPTECCHLLSQTEVFHWLNCQKRMNHGLIDKCKLMFLCHARSRSISDNTATEKPRNTWDLLTIVCQRVRISRQTNLGWVAWRNQSERTCFTVE